LTTNFQGKEERKKFDWYGAMGWRKMAPTDAGVPCKHTDVKIGDSMHMPAKHISLVSWDRSEQ
jgi:hypothetical protein